MITIAYVIIALICCSVILCFSFKLGYARASDEFYPVYFAAKKVQLATTGPDRELQHAGWELAVAVTNYETSIGYVFSELSLHD